MSQVPRRKRSVKTFSTCSVCLEGGECLATKPIKFDRGLALDVCRGVIPFKAVPETSLQRDYGAAYYSVFGELPDRLPPGNNGYAERVEVRRDPCRMSMSAFMSSVMIHAVVTNTKFDPGLLVTPLASHTAEGYRDMSEKVTGAKDPDTSSLMHVNKLECAYDRFVDSERIAATTILDNRRRGRITIRAAFYEDRWEDLDIGWLATEEKFYRTASTEHICGNYQDVIKLRGLMKRHNFKARIMFGLRIRAFLDIVESILDGHKLAVYELMTHKGIITDTMLFWSQVGQRLGELNCSPSIKK